jgi:hypothetical protein
MRYCRTAAHDITDTYQPERHYMRGPGPKWREKHAQPGIDSPYLLERRNVPCWRCTILALTLFAAITSFIDPASMAPAQGARSASSEEKAAAPSRPCEARHPAKSANAPIGQCQEGRTD